MPHRLLPAAGIPLLVLVACLPQNPGGNPLIGAAREGDIPAIRRLLRAGADPNAPGGVNGWTPLMHAIHKHKRGSVIALLDGGAGVNAGDPHGRTPLMMAAGYGYTEIVRDLLAQGANPYAKDCHGVTALAEAVGGTLDIDRFTAGHCQTETVKALLDAAPALRLGSYQPGRLSVLAARLGGCSEVLKLLGR